MYDTTVNNIIQYELLLFYVRRKFNEMSTGIK